MKISLNWIREFTAVDIRVDELVTKIGAQLGAVEEVVDLGRKYQGIVVAKVVSCEKHPNADKLKVCLIDDGGAAKDVARDENGRVQVVCGAPNVREGLLVAWLPPRVIVPSTYDKDPLTLEAREIRGVVSNGMLASGHELGISDDHSGIAELSFGEPGNDFAKEYMLDDYVIDIENKMFTHRPDCFGILGVAREIAGITGQQFKSLGWYIEDNTQEDNTEATSTYDLDLTFENKIPDQVPRFMAQVIEGVSVKPSVIWMQGYLSRVGLKPINNVVDMTNFMMHYTAQPLHAYDYDKLCQVAGTKTAQLETRLSKKGDKLKLLSGKTITFEDEETILITSNDVPVGIGGIMGGLDTEVDEHTKNIVLECANFNMYSIRRSSMRHGLFTDAVTRFNKGQSSLQNPAVLKRSVLWTIHRAGGKAGKMIDDCHNLKSPATVRLTRNFVNERLGLELDIKAMAKLLTNVEFEVAIDGQNLMITPPFWRMDIEIPEDIVEEIGRMYGYDRLPQELPKRDLAPAARDQLLELKNRVREILSTAGANEVLTYSFVHGKLLDKVGQDKNKAYELSNALSPDLQYYRVSLTPCLLDKVHANGKAGHDQFALFELGKAHIKGQQDTAEPDVPKEVNALSLVFSVQDKAAAEHGGAVFYQAKKYLSSVLSSFGVTHEVTFESLDGADLYKNPWIEQMTAPFEPNRSAVLRDSQGLIWGVVGEFKHTIRQALKLPEFTAGFEVDPLLFLKGTNAAKYVPLPRFPKVEQDISLKVAAELTYGELYDFVWQKIEELKPPQTLATLDPLDIYQKADDQDHKQVTLRLTIASYERTLTAPEVNDLLDEVAALAQGKLRAERL